jgi:4-hydroxy-3-methylbut-2-enyl diphosphate reductase
VAVEDDDDENRPPAEWAEDLTGSPTDVKQGQIRQGVVAAVTDDGVVVDIGAKIDGFIPLSEFPTLEDRPNVDDEIEVAVVRIDEKNDTIRLSKKRADYERTWNVLEEMAKEGGIVEAMVKERVKGGLRVDVGVSGFVPASHVGTRNLRNLERFVGRTLRLKVIEADRASKKVILTHRELLEAEREERKAETILNLDEGAIVEGKVRNLTNYGAFIDLGGVDGLLHVSEMSWTRVGHPSEVMQVGDSVRVVVLEIANEGQRISLGMRQILPDPWKEAAGKLNPGSVIKGRITRIVPTGAFAMLLDAGIEGFIPIREMSERRIAEPGDVIQRDQEVDLKILDIRKEARKMTLSLVAAEQEKERAQYKEFMDTTASPRMTLGDQFGDVLASFLSDDSSAPAPVEAPAAPKPEPVAAPEPVAVVAPVVEEAPPVVEAPAVEEAPAVAEAPVAEEAPAADEAPAVEEAPAAEEETPGEQ